MIKEENRFLLHVIEENVAESGEDFAIGGTFSEIADSQPLGGEIFGEHSGTGIPEHASGNLHQLRRFGQLALLRQCQQSFIGAGSPEEVGETGGEFKVVELSNLPRFQSGGIRLGAEDESG